MLKKITVMTTLLMLMTSPSLVYAGEHGHKPPKPHGAPAVVFHHPHYGFPKRNIKVHYNRGDFELGGVVAGVVGGVVSSVLNSGQSAQIYSQPVNYVVPEKTINNTIVYSVPMQQNCTTYVSAVGGTTQHCIVSY